ncbi:unnamed protein product [Didymodactylos carnosus]|uniref:Uncharacterized protein n=1 Tax=Didymodactylos carnosus TaxID=1234261 RepID=A0A815AMA2_9BILA|nr:unnamed protein product [Didymodactylos carnosus]CAF1257961.1 unnamed protein product [Didymodactylos carnosus]CAF3830926.1 unnamed protein product [Didymodactylos carnosus]CAF4032779.1 unnamed protein product [Didymodactylos carnosus]
MNDRAKDKAALGYDYKAPLEKHSSQTDASKGFGGKFGIEKNAQDKSAVGFSHKEQVEKHPSQKDYNIGFGKIGGPKSESNKAVESSDHHMSKNIVEKHPSTISSQPVSGSEGVKNIRARFENIKKEQEEETAKRIAEERFQRNKVESGKVPFSSSAAIIAPSVSVKNGHERQSSPSPPPLQRKEEENADIYENIDVIQQIVQKPTEQPKMINNKRLSNQEETVKPQVIGGMDLSGLRLRKRHDSSDSQNQEESTDEEWGDQKYKKHITKKPSQEEVRSSIKHEPQQQQQQQHEEQLLQSNQSQMYSTVDEVIKCRALYDYDTG